MLEPLAVLVRPELPAQTVQLELPAQRELPAQLEPPARRELPARQELPAQRGLPARQELWGPLEPRGPLVRQGPPAQLVQPARPAEPADWEPPGQQERLVSAPWAALAPSGPAHLVEQAPSALSHSAPLHHQKPSVAQAASAQPEPPELSLQEARPASLAPPEQPLAPPV